LTGTVSGELNSGTAVPDFSSDSLKYLLTGVVILLNVVENVYHTEAGRPGCICVLALQALCQSAGRRRSSPEGAMSREGGIGDRMLVSRQPARVQIFGINSLKGAENGKKKKL